MQKRARAGWFGRFQREERVEGGQRTAHGARPAFPAYVGAMERYPTHSYVALPDGQLLCVRRASLAAAKDLLAAPHADLADLAAEPAR